MLLTLIFALWGSTTAMAEPGTPRHILFLGNSYLYYGDSLHTHVERMANAAQPQSPRAEFTSATISGARLADHPLDHHLSVGAERLGHPFDAVVLQGHSTATFPENRAAFQDTVRQMAVAVRASGAEPVLYMTPAYAPTAQAYRPDMLSGLDETYTALGQELGARVIPVAHAFALAQERRPGLMLRKPWDGSHPSSLGIYLAAATVYAALFDGDVTANPYTYFGSFPEEEVTFLQQVAQDAVAAYDSRAATQ